MIAARECGQRVSPVAGRLPVWVVAGLAVLVVSGCAVRPAGPRGPAADAIDAAVTVELENERLPMLRAIARRADLSQNDQEYLVNAVCHGGFGGTQADTLITLLDNPVCTEKTRRYMADRLRFVTYSTERRRVAEALGRAPARTGD